MARLSTLVFAFALLAGLSTSNRVGVNFALKLQRRPLQNRAAARIFRSKFRRITKAKIFDHDAAVVDALRAEGIRHVMIAVPNFQVGMMANNIGFSNRLVQSVIKPQVDRGLKISVAIANEPFAPWNNINAGALERAYRNLRSALAGKRLSRSVKITIPFYFGIIGNSYPPNAGSFAGNRVAALRSLAALLFADRSNFVINIYPFFTHRDNPRDIPLSYALGVTGHSVGGSTYNGLLQAQVAAVRAALLRIDGRYTNSGLPIVVGETGWPTAGHGSANVANAAKYNSNAAASGVSLYLFEAFDEKRKSGDAVEVNFGIFTESGVAKYNIPALQ